jgi:glycosyltransferase involved in cell wall biosynthesis
VAKFSVVIPIYNIEKYLRQCLDSIVTQTYRNLEIILVDDGSKDNCPAICDSYASTDSRIKVIHKKNGGLVSARKAGAKEATAEYIACVDGDDWIEKDYFEKFADVIEEYSPDVVCCGTILQKGDGSTQRQEVKERYGYYEKDDLTNIIYPHLMGFSGNIWGKVFKRDVYMEVQLGLDERIKIAEDACVVIPCVHKAESLFILEECLYNYRHNPASMTKNKSVYNLEEPKMIARHLEKYLDLKQNSFRQQIYISTVHRLFNRCVSQFYQELTYHEICKSLDSCLDDRFYQECITKSRISPIHSPKEWLALQALKRRWYRLMKIYNRIG